MEENSTNIIETQQKNDEKDSKPKRIRRTNNMIEKKIHCPVEKCDKVYASEGSLQQHLKIKHPEI